MAPSEIDALSIPRLLCLFGEGSDDGQETPTGGRTVTKEQAREHLRRRKALLKGRSDGKSEDR